MAETDNEIVLINRKLWVALAEHQTKKRRHNLGSGFATPCSQCSEILMCEGPVGFHICRTIKKMEGDGLIKGGNWILHGRRRKKMLPASKDCLRAYGLLRPGNK